MTSYTLRLKDVIELSGGDEAVATGLDRYPLYDEAHRPVLNEKIIQTYWNEEIAHETDSMFRQSMRARMLLIMDTYNKLFESEALEYDPLLSVDMTTDSDTQSHTDTEGHTDTQTGTTAEGHSDTTNTSESSGTGAARNFTFPQQQIGIDGAYATTGSESTSGSTGSGTGSEDTTSSQDSTGTEDSTGTQDGTTSGTTHQHGRGQSAQSLIAEFRNNILNIDMMIVDDLSIMFMDTWTTGQAFMAQESSLYRPYYRGW